MLSRRLSRKGFDVVPAVDGLQGVSLASAAAPDLILMDLSLPGIDGWEATRRLKADPATRAIPVIALTAHAMSGDQEQALAAGCDDFDTKPVDLVRLLGKIRHLLDNGAQGTGTGTTTRPGDTTGTRTRTTTGTTVAAPHDRPAEILFDEVLPAQRAGLAAARAALDDVCAKAGIASDIGADLHVVLDEACANIIAHAYAPALPGPLRVTLRVLPAIVVDEVALPAAIEIVVADQGPPFDPLALPTPDLGLPWDERPLGGVGVHLIRSLTDEQSYSHSEIGGNRLTLRRHLP
ncbi:MAG: ATP-binding protein [Burkholderiaceae bacterium]